MKYTEELEESLDWNHFHPLNFFVPSNIRQIKPYEVMLDGTIVSVFSFYAESQEKELFLKISTNEKRQYNENLTYMMDNIPDCMLKKYNSFSFSEKCGKTYFYSVFEMIESTLDDFISRRLDSNNFDEIWVTKNLVNPSLTNHHNPLQRVSSMKTPETLATFKEDELMREDEVIYMIKSVLFAFADLQKARIWHRDIRPDNIAMVPYDEPELEFRGSQSSGTESRYGKTSKLARGSTVSYNINSKTDLTGNISGRRSNGASLRNQYFDRSTRGRSTEGTNSSIIGRVHMKIFNFDASEVLDHHIADNELEYGIEMKNYPCYNDAYASQYVIDYIEANAIKNAKHLIQSDSMNIKKMNVCGSRQGKRYKKLINPFREDVFAFGMTLLQLITLKT